MPEFDEKPEKAPARQWTKEDIILIIAKIFSKILNVVIIATLVGLVVGAFYLLYIAMTS